jgi:Flp pilus assembly secretin CpaC
MKQRLLVAVAILATLASARVHAQGQARIREEALVLQVNQLRTLKNVGQVNVADPSVLDVSPLEDGSGVILTAIAPGTTDLEYYLLDEPTVARVREVTVRARDIEAVRREVETLLSYMVGLQVERAGAQSLVIKGQVLERSDRDHLTKVLAAYPSSTDLKVFDFTRDEFLDTEERRLQRQVENDLASEKLTTIRVEVKNVRGEFKALLKGRAFTDQARNRAQEIAELYYEDVINLVELEKPVIELDVIVAELDLNKTKQLGTNDVFAQATNFALTGYLNSNFGRSSFYDLEDDNTGQNVDGEPGGVQRPDEPAISSAPTISIAGPGVSSFIRAVASAGAAIFYTEQHQAVLSGQDAKFNDGRDLQIPVGGGDGDGDVVSVQTGLIINVTPEQKENGRIRNTVAVENSVITDLIATQTGLAVDIDRFRSESIVECGNDETIVLAGADTQRLTHGDTGTPYLRRIPIVNLLFRARDKDGIESRSMILVTPTSSTIRREPRQAFSVDSFRKRDFIQEEAPYWERDIDWGHYDEFYRRPERQFKFINSYEHTLYYDEVDVTDELGAAPSSFTGESMDDGMMGDDSMMMEGDGMMSDDSMTSDDSMMMEEPASDGSMMSE